jgi:hypothetical protein
MVEDRAAYGALVLPRSGAGILLVANGGGHAVETILVQLGQQVTGAGGTTLRTVNVAPTSPNDPNGTVEFYCVAFLMLGSAIGATVLGRVVGPVHGVRGPRGAPARLGLVLVYAALLSASVTFFADIVLGELVGHFGVLFLTLWLYSAAICLAITGLSALIGLGAIVLILVLICLGNPSSGGPVPRPLLNGFYSGLNPVMPQGAELSAVRAVQYFGGWGAGEGPGVPPLAVQGMLPRCAGRKRAGSASPLPFHPGHAPVRARRLVPAARCHPGRALPLCLRWATAISCRSAGRARASTALSSSLSRPSQVRRSWERVPNISPSTIRPAPVSRTSTARRSARSGRRSAQPRRSRPETSADMVGWLTCSRSASTVTRCGPESSNLASARPCAMLMPGGSATCRISCDNPDNSVPSSPATSMASLLATSLT